jgi:hypothetical protein
MNLHWHAGWRVPNTLARRQVGIHVLLGTGFYNLHPLHPANIMSHYIYCYFTQNVIYLDSFLISKQLILKYRIVKCSKTNPFRIIFNELSYMEKVGRAANTWSAYVCCSSVAIHKQIQIYKEFIGKQIHDTKLWSCMVFIWYKITIMQYI